MINLGNVFSAKDLKNMDFNKMKQNTGNFYDKDGKAKELRRRSKKIEEDEIEL